MRFFRRIGKWILILGSTLCFSLLLFGTFVIAPRIKSKTGAHHAAALTLYKGLLQDVGPEAQFEAHTCGLHALRVIYRAYGLDPDKENLRFRLGVDVPSNPIDRESTGTLQPDMLRVLNQDGFDYTILPIVDAARSASDLLDHLNAGNAAAILISRRENGNMHWVAALKPANEKIVILDSLFPDPYSEEPIPFVRDCVLSCILIQPKGVPPETTNSPMRDGIDALRTTIKRYQEVRKIRRKQAE